MELLSKLSVFTFVISEEQCLTLNLNVNTLVLWKINKGKTQMGQFGEIKAACGTSQSGNVHI